MDGVYPKIDRTLRTCEEVNADPALGRKVEDRCATCYPVGHKHIGRKFVGGIDETPGALKPRLKASRTGKKIPAENNWRKAQACIGSPPMGLV